MTTQTKQNTEIANKNGSEITKRPPGVVGEVFNSIMKLQQAGAIELPPGYSAGNALNSARLVLLGVQNANHAFILKDGDVDENVVSRTSVVMALQKYISLGLNVDFDQAYFIVYGKTLQCQRSYRGEESLAKRVRPEIEFYSDSVRQGEHCLLEKAWSREAGYITVVKEHRFDPDRPEEIVSAYCGAVNKITGEDLGVKSMSMSEIKKHWAVNSMYKENGAGVHQKWPEAMCLKVVISARARSIYKGAPDSRLKATIQRLDDDVIEMQVEADAAENANKEFLSLPAGQTNIETGEVRSVLTDEEKRSIEEHEAREAAKSKAGF